jgi:hypothetical protein
MKRVVIHWTGGTYTCTALDKQHYHWVIDGDGKVHKANDESKNNRNVKGLLKHQYAAHTLGTNSYSIGVSMCGMAGATPKNFGKHPIKRSQWDVMVSHVADRCVHWGIPVTPETVLTHAEVQNTLRIPQKGKWDIAVLPWDASIIGSKAVGEKLRWEVAAQITAKTRKSATPVSVTTPVAVSMPKPAPVNPVPSPQAQQPAPGKGDARPAPKLGFWASLIAKMGKKPAA